MWNEQDSMHKSQQHIDEQLTEDKVKKVEPKPVTIDIDPNRKRYGKMIILFEKGPFLISIGPDYLCFLGGFLFFFFLAYFLCVTVKGTFQNQIVIYTTYLLSFLQCGSYFLVALSNPGVVLRENNQLKQINTSNQHRICKKCGAENRRKTFHCRQCDVCIKGYDHHCPWTSKCIGEGNLYRFYFFVTITPIYIIFFMGLMMGCLVISAQKINQNIRTNS